jgi:single-stranded DNA-specific DHH superfamily exonuclease
LDSLHDPYLFADMQKAVDRIKLAKQNGEKVFIF